MGFRLLPHGGISGQDQVRLDQIEPLQNYISASDFGLRKARYAYGITGTNGASVLSGTFVGVSIGMIAVVVWGNNSENVLVSNVTAASLNSVTIADALPASISDGEIYYGHDNAVAHTGWWDQVLAASQDPTVVDTINAYHPEGVYLSSKSLSNGGADANAMFPFAKRNHGWSPLKIRVYSEEGGPFPYLQFGKNVSAPAPRASVAGCIIIPLTQRSGTSPTVFGSPQSLFTDTGGAIGLMSSVYPDIKGVTVRLLNNQNYALSGFWLKYVGSAILHKCIVDSTADAYGVADWTHSDQTGFMMPDLLNEGISNLSLCYSFGTYTGFETSEHFHGDDYWAQSNKYAMKVGGGYSTYSAHPQWGGHFTWHHCQVGIAPTGSGYQNISFSAIDIEYANTANVNGGNAPDRFITTYAVDDASNQLVGTFPFNSQLAGLGNSQLFPVNGAQYIIIKCLMAVGLSGRLTGNGPTSNQDFNAASNGTYTNITNFYYDAPGDGDYALEVGFSLYTTHNSGVLAYAIRATEGLTNDTSVSAISGTLRCVFQCLGNIQSAISYSCILRVRVQGKPRVRVQISRLSGSSFDSTIISNATDGYSRLSVAP